nr:hypothetical protein SHINE37_43522 [Rhizobiaceae bacterium]
MSLERELIPAGFHTRRASEQAALDACHARRLGVVARCAEPDYEYSKLMVSKKSAT